MAELCKGVHCADLGESFQTHIYLQNLASIQPRTSPVKFAHAAARHRRHPGMGSPSPVACSLLCVDSVGVQNGG